MSQRPRAVIIAGPNGSGKSTLTKQLQDDSTFDFPPSYINADELARNATKGTQEERERAAFHRARTLRRTYREQGISHAFETVFSHPSTLLDIMALKVAGFDVTLVFVTTSNPRINIGRVAGRVQEGGHDVPREKIAERYERAMRFLPRACELVDRAIIFDASDRTRLAAWIEFGEVETDLTAPAYLVERLVVPLRERAEERERLGEVQQPDESAGTYQGIITRRLKHYALQEADGPVCHDLSLCTSELIEGKIVLIRYEAGYFTAAVQ